MDEMKITLAKFLTKYNLVATADTKLEFLKGDLFFLSFPEVKIKLQVREL